MMALLVELVVHYLPSDLGVGFETHTRQFFFLDVKWGVSHPKVFSLAHL